ncbi:ABC transporter ATP-binding protein [Bacillus sp. 1P06AnD]|uniref:ABC transporter ATP-binding protein n=1 Tax=Bacillus sp. 1P06AnD TaxID=3132208 RepID=UPI0039A14D45
MMITLTDITGGYSRQADIVRNLSLNVEKGTFFSLVGPNGSGKTTLIRLMMGALQLRAGTVMIAGKPLEDYSVKELARKVAVMTQENEVGMDFSAWEIVGLGRYPHQSGLLLRDASQEDEQVIRRVMEQTSTWELRNEIYGALSGGQKQRVLLAKALAQQPQILLLDEPTNHLDARHSMELLDLLKELQCEEQLTIMAILHDLNIASLYSDQIGLMEAGRLIGVYNGLSEREQPIFSDTYGVDMFFGRHPKTVKTAVFFEPGFLKGKEAYPMTGCLECISASNSIQLSFGHSVKTLTSGLQGKGFSWEDGWILTEKGIRKNNVLPVGFLPLPKSDRGEFAISFGEAGEVSSWMPGSHIPADTHILMFLFLENGSCHLTLLMSNKLSDTEMVQLSNVLTQELTRLHILQSGSTCEIAIQQLSISCSPGNGNSNSNGNEVAPTCKELLRYVYKRVSGN